MKTSILPTVSDILWAFMKWRPEARACIKDGAENSFKECKHRVEAKKEEHEEEDDAPGQNWNIKREVLGLNSPKLGERQVRKCLWVCNKCKSLSENIILENMKKSF